MPVWHPEGVSAQNRFLFTLRIVRAILYKEFLCLGEIF